MNIIHINFGQDLSEGRSPKLGLLLNQLRYRMEMAAWSARNLAARPSEDPATWDWEALELLEQEYEMVGLP